MVLGISSHSINTLEDFIEDQGITFPVLHDNNGVYGQYNITGGQSPYPRDFIIDQSGIIQYADTEYDPGTMINVIESLFVNEIAIEANHDEGWNLVGLPLEVDDNSVNSLFPDGISGTLFLYDGAYLSVDELVPGIGYWLRFSELGSNTLIGNTLNSVIVTLFEGWNLVSGPSFTATIDDPNGIVISGTLFGYNGAYINVDELEPGKGYWIRANTAGTITLDASSGVRNSVIAGFPLNSNVITFTNSDGFSYDLYAGAPFDEDVYLSNSLPPVPPSGGFDIRFEGDLKVADDDGQILIQNSQWPLIMVLNQAEWNRELGSESWVLEDEISGIKYNLNENSAIEIPQPTDRLTLYRSNLTPEHFVLYQNYPNPFNLVTTIRFDLPEVSNVSLIVYDLMGREVATLVNGKLVSGHHEIIWNGNRIASGIYVYKLTSGSIQLIRKMVLLK
tara:strand:- start:14280 stop:15620 length:1341 start_codon:yes stop_codon:yes gene_type:complete